jgi:HEAT repeat protein
MGDDWEAWVESEVTRIQKDGPETYNAMRSLQPRATRAGFPRFTGPLVRDPNAAPILLDRYLNGNEPIEVRAALIEALSRTTGEYGAALVDLYGREQDARVREAMMSALRTAKDADSALALLGLGLSDRDPVVRAEAARMVARRKDGGRLSSELIAAAGDGDATVQVEAMRALGAHKIAAAKEALTGELESTSADVRLNALRALGRIDEAYAAALPEVETLAKDSDARVAKVAAKLSAK